MKVAVRIHGAGRHVIETFGNLPIAFGLFWAEFAGGGGDVIGSEKGELARLPVPDEELELSFFFQSTQENGIAKFQPLRLKVSFQFGANVFGRRFGPVFSGMHGCFWGLRRLSFFFTRCECREAQADGTGNFHGHANSPLCGVIGKGGSLWQAFEK